MSGIEKYFGKPASPMPATPAQPPTPSPAPAPAPAAPILQSGASFATAVAFTLQNEGGFSNVPQDAGGATNFGITMAEYAVWIGHAVSVTDVENMTLATAEAIYEANYWMPEYAQLSQPVATAIFDWGVLHGPANAEMLAQQIANAHGASIAVDGAIGPQSVAAINAMPASTFIQAYAAGMKAWFAADVAANPSQAVFLDGWNARADRIAALA